MLNQSNYQQAKRLKIISAGTVGAVQTNVTKFINLYAQYLKEIDYSIMSSIKSHNDFDNTIDDLFVMNITFNFDYTKIDLMDNALVDKIVNEPIRGNEGWGNQPES